MLKIVKRLPTTARETHVLLRELLVYSLGWLDVESDPGAGSFGLVASGSDGETSSSAPAVFTAASATFAPAHVGKYLTIWGGTVPFSTVGVYRIVSVQSATQVTLVSGLYGAQLSTATGVNWRLVDPTLNTDATEFVVQSNSGTGTPAWQARIYMDLVDTTTIRYEVSPFGGWSVGPGWTGSFLPSQSIDCDATPMWYIHAQPEALVLFTEAVGGASVFEFGYIGTGTPRRPDVDDHFAVATGATIPSCFGSIYSLAADNATVVQYEALNYTGDTLPTLNYFTSLPNSPFDLRRDTCEVAVGCSLPGFEEEDRGTLRSVRFVSDLIPYRSFVDNGRTYVSLGSGFALLWDGSLSA